MEKLKLKTKSKRVSSEAQKIERHAVKQRAEAKKAGIERRKQTLEWIYKTYPVFRKFRPLQTGTVRVLKDRPHEGISNKDLQMAVNFHCSGFKYLQNIIERNRRYTIDNKPSDEVITPEQKQYSKKALAEAIKRMKIKQNMTSKGKKR